jgi:DNA-binding MarR family transcriptional regulator
MGEGSEIPPFGLHAALARHTGFLIHRLGMVARKRFATRMESMGLSVRMWGVLNVLDAEGALTQHALGRCVGIDPSSMVSTIDELEEAGLVERRRHPSDRRAHAMHLTPKGREALVRGRTLARGAQEELLAPLSATERKQLHEMLLRVALHADECETDEAGTRDRGGTGSEPRAAAG